MLRFVLWLATGLASVLLQLEYTLPAARYALLNHGGGNVWRVRFKFL
jgi:hypothetical protein